MKQTANKPYKHKGFTLLSLGTNGLFLFHLSFSLSFIFFILSNKEPPTYYYKLLAIMLTKFYMIFYFVSDLWLFLLLKYKQRKNLMLGTDYWLAALLGIKYLFTVFLLSLLLLFCCLFRNPMVY